MRKTKTEITIETCEVLIIRRGPGASRIPCRQCQDRVLMVTAEEAMVLAGTNARAIYQWVEGGLVHYQEMPAGLLLVCSDSIMKLANRTKQSD